MSVLTCENLSGGYGRVRVVEGVDLDLDGGRCHALLGANGVGKSTLLKTILGLCDRHGGALAVDGRSVAGWPVHRTVRLGVAYIPQDHAIFGDFTVAENLQLAGGARRSTALKTTFEAFPLLAERRDQAAGTLSGGEQKLLLLARALIHAPGLLLIDELSEGVQPSVTTHLAAVIGAYVRDHQAAALIVEQNVDFARTVADTYAVMRRGCIVAEGDAAELDTRILDAHIGL